MQSRARGITSERYFEKRLADFEKRDQTRRVALSLSLSRCGDHSRYRYGSMSEPFIEPQSGARAGPREKESRESSADSRLVSERTSRSAERESRGVMARIIRASM